MVCCRFAWRKPLLWDRIGHVVWPLRGKVLEKFGTTQLPKLRKGVGILSPLMPLLRGPFWEGRPCFEFISTTLKVAFYCWELSDTPSGTHIAVSQVLLYVIFCDMISLAVPAQSCVLAYHIMEPKVCRGIGLIFDPSYVRSFCSLTAEIMRIIVLPRIVQLWIKKNSKYFLERLWWVPMGGGECMMIELIKAIRYLSYLIDMP
jgi:hypothetical protein